MGPEFETLEVGRRADRVGQPRRPVRRLGGVLGDVGGDGSGVLAGSGHEHPDVVLGAPCRPAQVLPTTDGSATLARATASRWTAISRARASSHGGGGSSDLRAVGPEDHMEMDETPALELDHLHVREPHPARSSRSLSPPAGPPRGRAQ